MFKYYLTRKDKTYFFRHDVIKELLQHELDEYGTITDNSLMQLSHVVIETKSGWIIKNILGNFPKEDLDTEYLQELKLRIVES